MPRTDAVLIKKNKQGSAIQNAGNTIRELDPFAGAPVVTSVVINSRLRVSPAMHRWIPAKTCKKPRYGRGVGTLPYKPWTKGFGCNGFGVNGDGGCAKIDILKYITLPYGIKC